MKHGSESSLVNDRLNQSLATSGLRFTRQRQHIYDVLLQERDHPTAEEVCIRAKRIMPEISLATVYNCLETLEKCGLVRQVNLERTASRYCPNMEEHCHFYCDHCARVYDIDLEFDRRATKLSVPKGFHATAYEVSIRGTCPKCSGKINN